MKDLWIPVSGTVAQQKQVESIANNLANANTPGFKRDAMSFREHVVVAQKSQVEPGGTHTIFQQGRAIPTQNPLDLGLEGPGFFEVLTPRGIRYTRNGSLGLSPAGHLVTANGHYILGVAPEDNPEVSPEERRIQLQGPRVSINQQGDIVARGQKVARLSLVEFRDLRAIKKEGAGNYANLLDGNAIPSATRVRQGLIEGSNVNAVSEMSNLIKANRQFETLQRVIKAYDQISSRSINELSNF